MTTVNLCQYPRRELASIYVANNGAGAKFYKLNGAGEYVASGPTGAPANYPVLNSARDKLFLGQVTSTRCGYVDLGTNAITSFAGSDPGLGILIDDETEFFCAPVNGGYILRLLVLDGSLISAQSWPDSGALGYMVKSADGLFIYAGMYGGPAVFVVYDLTLHTITTYAITNFGLARGIAQTHDGTKAYIPCVKSGVPVLLIVDVLTGLRVHDFNLPDVGSTVAVKPDNGAHYAVNHFSNSVGEIWIYRSSDNVLLFTVPCGASANYNRGLRYSPDGAYLYSAAGTSLEVFETETYTLVHTEPLAGDVYGIDIG
jgi:hypothetical protein